MTIKEQVAEALKFRRDSVLVSDKALADEILAIARPIIERETLERAAKVAEGEKYGERVTQATYNEGNDTLSYYNEACDDIAQAIRSLTDRK